MAMEALTHRRPIKSGGWFYVGQFLSRATVDVLAGPVPEMSLDRPTPAASVFGGAGSAPAPQRLRRE